MRDAPGRIITVTRGGPVSETTVAWGAAKPGPAQGAAYALERSCRVSVGIAHNPHRTHPVKTGGPHQSHQVAR